MSRDNNRKTAGDRRKDGTFGHSERKTAQSADKYTRKSEVLSEEELSGRIEGRNAEDIANIAIIVIHQTLALLRGLIDRIDRQFLQEGGIKEQRYQARINYRNNIHMECQ